MIRYRHDPDIPERPIIEATPSDIDQFRPLIRARLRRAFPKIGDDGVEDAVQLAIIAACRCISQGTVRGRHGRSAESALRGWLTEVAWRLGMNTRRSAQFRYSVIEVGSEHDAADGRSLPEAIVDARRMLERIDREMCNVGIRALVMLADGATYREVARDIGISTDTVRRQILAAQIRLAEMRDRVPWEEPKQPPPRTPRGRKRKR